ncbi:MAG: hypothetical protein WCR47_02865 [Desulfoplanes sp.]
MHDMPPNYPDDCIQCVADPWWENDDSQRMARGRLVWSYIYLVDQRPFVLKPIGRSNSRVHSLADCEFCPLDFTNPPSRANLPVAGMYCGFKEIFTVYRAKKRPALVLAEPGTEVPYFLRQNQPIYQTLPTYLVAPYYGADQGTGTRAGFKPQFVERIRHCEYPQFFWDSLPVPGSTKESILRLDQIQPLGTRHREAFEATPYRLSDDALAIMDEWLEWKFTGNLPVPDPNAENQLDQPLLYDFRKDLMGLSPST